MNELKDKINSAFCFFSQMEDIIIRWKKLRKIMCCNDMFTHEVVEGLQWMFLQNVIHKVATWFRDNSCDASYKTACNFEMTVDELLERVDAVTNTLYVVDDCLSDIQDGEGAYMSCLSAFADYYYKKVKI